MDWHRLIDGDPPTTGRYIVAHRATAALAIYRVPAHMPPGSATKGWDRDVSFATHWAKEPHAPDDGTPQLFTPAGRQKRCEADEVASWEAIAGLSTLAKGRERG